VQDDFIRTAEASDWPEIEWMLVDAGLPLSGAREALAHFSVAEHEGRVVACAALEPYHEAFLLRSVAVRADRRGMGSGARLVETILAKIVPARPVVLLTTSASEWFRRFGFRQVASDAVPVSVTQSIEFRGACPSTATIMIRKAV
jgi:amino-acid N-acetyltransferase